MTEKMIRDAYVKIRTIDQTIPDDVLNFMKDASIEKLKQVNNNNNNILADISCRAVWKRISSQYVDSNGLFIGEILVTEYNWNGIRPKGDPLIYKVTSPIKGIKDNLGSFATEDECKSRCLEVVNTFVKMLQHGS